MTADTTPPRHAGRARRGHHHARTPLRAPHWAAIAATAVATAAVSIGFLATLPNAGAGPAAATIRPAVHRYCPLTDCSAYPDPARVKGITVAALQDVLLSTAAVRRQIAAAAPMPRRRRRCEMPGQRRHRPECPWNANAVRLQISQDWLVGPGGVYSPARMAVIRSVVSYALARGLAVILNAQTEASPWASLAVTATQNLPTPATAAFWQPMIAAYGHNPRVIFDLFNEPRNTTWPAWQAAFQPLVTTLRADGSRNEIWVEGIWWGATLAGVPLLAGQGIVYVIHHPCGPWPWEDSMPGEPRGIVGPPVWQYCMGYLRAEHVPVVDGEFVNFLGGGYYWPHSTQMVVEFLRWLRSHGIGVVAWSLQAGIMTKNADDRAPLGEPRAAGRILWDYFHGLPLPDVPLVRYPGLPPGSELAPLRYR